VVAPELDQSGVSHSLSLNDPLRCARLPTPFRGAGTPDRLRDHGRAPLSANMPDLVLSG